MLKKMRAPLLTMSYHRRAYVLIVVKEFKNRNKKYFK